MRKLSRRGSPQTAASLPEPSTAGRALSALGRVHPLSRSPSIVALGGPARARLIQHPRTAFPEPARRFELARAVASLHRPPAPRNSLNQNSLHPGHLLSEKTAPSSVFAGSSKILRRAAVYEVDSQAPSGFLLLRCLGRGPSTPQASCGNTKCHTFDAELHVYGPVDVRTHSGSLESFVV